MKHVAGKRLSRWTEFLTPDSEKPQRDRDDEFADSFRTHAELIDYWNRGWNRHVGTLDSDRPGAIAANITIRGESISVSLAIGRSLFHCGCHIGQIVVTSRILADSHWQTLTIPHGGSQQHNTGNWSREQYRI